MTCRWLTCHDCDAHRGLALLLDREPFRRRAIADPGMVLVCPRCYSFRCVMTRGWVMKRRRVALTLEAQRENMSTPLDAR